MNFKYYFEAKIEETQDSQDQEPIQEFYTTDTSNAYQSFKYALDKYWGGKYPTSSIFTSELIAKLGFDFNDLMKKKIIQPSRYGNYELNPDLASTGGKLKLFQSPPPALPIKKISWQDYIKKMKQMGK